MGIALKAFAFNAAAYRGVCVFLTCKAVGSPENYRFDVDSGDRRSATKVSTKPDCT
jgi:hypothetical protein